MSGLVVTLGGESVTLVAPSSIQLRWDVMVVAASNLQRAEAAALGICWPGSGKVCRVTPSMVRYDLAEYGGRVADALAARGVDLAEIWGAGRVALRLVSEGLVTPSDVEQAKRDFSEPGESTS